MRLDVPRKRVLIGLTDEACGHRIVLDVLRCDGEMLITTDNSVEEALLPERTRCSEKVVDAAS